MPRLINCSSLAITICFGFAIPAAAQVGFGVVGGVSIDAQGMLHDTRTLSQDERLKLLKQQAAGQPGSEKLAAGSTLRRVSLKRLEQAVQKLHRVGQTLPADVEYLAGLTAIHYIVFDPAHRDVILVGPAEGWTQLPTGEIAGQKSQRPVLHLEDLITALRYSFAKAGKDPFIGCSIDPTQEGMARYAAYMNSLGGRMDRSRTKQIFGGMEQAMGPQAVRLFGVAHSSRFALAMLAADYRLKRISLGHDPSPVKDFVNYLDLAAKTFHPGPQKQHRWWFQAQYDAILETPDHLAFQLIGQGVKVVTAPTSLAQQPGVKAAPEAEEVAETFTKHFTAIAQKQPVFAELQNLISLAATAELIAEKQDQPGGRRHWQPRHFLDAKACGLREYYVPKHVPAISNYRLIQNRHWLISISGGVDINPKKLIDPKNRKPEPPRPLNEVQEQTDPPKAASEWWWDEE